MIVIAGMEGALASVIGGLTGAPVVAVPTSVGYGSALEGRDRPAGDARVVRERGDRRGHRQRVRRRVAPWLGSCGVVVTSAVIGRDAWPGSTARPVWPAT